MGRGRGRGFRWAQGFGQFFHPGFSIPYTPAPTPEQELTALKSQAEGIRGTLQSIQQRISELESEAKATE